MKQVRLEKRVLALTIFFGPALLLCSAAEAAQVFYVTGSTEKLCQVTGQIDPNTNMPKFGVIGTDLGFPVEYINPGDQSSTLYFLFGDTAGGKVTAVDPSVEFNPNGITVTPNPTLNLDSIGFSNATSPADLCANFQFIADSNGIYAPPQIDLSTYPANIRHMRHGTFGVPANGFSWGGRFYINFAHLDHVLPGEPPRRSVLASSADPRNVTPDGNTLFRYEFEISTDKFINISPTVIDKSNFAAGELPADGAAQALLLIGSGEYRKSPPFLAYVPLFGATVPDTSQWLYFAGFSGGLPSWQQGEANAVSLFSGVRNFEPCHPADGSTPCIGELSVTWNSFLNKWLMLYNGGGSARGIRFHVADKPWGPWSDVIVSSPRPDRWMRYRPA